MDNVKNVCNMSWSDIYDIEDIEERRLYISSDIESDVLDNIAYHILRYNRIDKDIPVEERKPIILYLFTPGGEVDAGWGLIDTILASKTPVYTVNQGMCASMGFLIFLAGHKRLTMPSAQFLMHDGSTSGWDSTAKMKDRIEFETVQLEQMTKKYIISKTKIDDKLYDEKYRVEWYMLPQEAKRYGICDLIVGEDCTIDDII